MLSKYIAGMAAVVALGWGAVDTFLFHGHWSDARLADDVRTMLGSKPYLEGNEPIVSNVNGHWLTLEGKLDSTEFKQDLGQAALDIPGIRGITNNIETLNTEALAQLKDLLAQPSAHAEMNYVIKEHGTVVLSGAVAEPSLKEPIERLVYALGGVQRVENHLGRELALEVEARIKGILRLNNIYFDFNKWSIRSDSKQALDEIASVLKEHPGLAISIEGHTDSIASERYNQWLSDKRAQAVVEALVERGILREGLVAKGWGESRPIASNSTPEGRADNRRIEFHVTGVTPAR